MPDLIEKFFLVGEALMGMDVRLCAPKQYWPDEDLVGKCRKIAEKSDARITITDRVEEGVKALIFYIPM